MRRMITCGGVVLALLTHINCNNAALTGPSRGGQGDGTLSSGSAGNPLGSGGSGGNGAAASGATAPDLAACDVVSLDRAGVRHRVEGLTLHIYAPSETAHYVDVWTPEVNETKLGRIGVNTWDSVQLPGYGTYRIKLAAERVDDGVVTQCDRHWFEVTAVRTPVPPPPPTCQGEQCEPPPPPPPTCEPIWTPISTSIVGGEWSACIDGERSREVVTTIIYGNQCDETTQESVTTTIQVEECEMPPEECNVSELTANGEAEKAECAYGGEVAYDIQACTYEVTCNEPPPEHGACFYEIKGNHDKEKCEANGGAWESHDKSSKCRFNFPGISNDDFNLTPGISDPECLRKQDN